MAYTLVPTELIVDGAITSAKLDTNIAISGTLGVTGEVTLATHLIMGDNDKIKIGTGGDLEIYHDGSNSYISNSTGNIYLGDTNGAVHIQAKLNEESIICAADGAVTLYHDNSPKLATSSAGVTVTGTLAATLSTAAQPNITSVGTLTGLTSTGNLVIGTEDNNAAIIEISGGATGSAEGGEIRLDTAADYDSTYEFYRLDVSQDDFRIGRQGQTDFTLFSDGTAQFFGNLAATLSTAAQPNITSVGTLTGFTSTGIDDNADATAITIDSNENIGIGTSTFTNSYKMYVEGLDQDTANLTDSGNHGATLYLRATANAVGSGGAVAFGTTFGNKTPFAAIKGHVTDGSTNTTGDLCFSTRASASATALTERLRINSTGIDVTGTATMDGLDVNGTITSYGLNFDVSDGVEINALESIVFDIDSDNNQTGRVFQVKANNSTALMTITETGNVGIGTTSPSVSLDIGSKTDAIKIPIGTTAQRPASPANGMVRYNTTESEYEVYKDNAWFILDSSNYTYTADFLVIAGGGGGSGASLAGGGGAGGYRTSAGTSGGGASAESALTFVGGTTYTITVGAGGSGGANGSNGGDSSISGSGLTTITSIGGGSGSNNGTAGASGGSGGGSGRDSVNTGGAGTAGQGFAGGNGGGSSNASAASGGGGAGAVGASASFPWLGGDGGVGVASTITGTSVYRAGGGGGAAYASLGRDGGTGGNGGGGNGSGNSATSATAGTANTGGGGGGGMSNSSGKAGGSGVVILRVATSKYSGITTGSPTVTTSGSNTIITFNSSGSYTA